MEYIPLHNLQQATLEVRRTLREGNGRVVLTEKGEPAYLLVDLKGQNVFPLINCFDNFRAGNEEPKSLESRQERLEAFRKLFAKAATIKDEDDVLNDDDWAELENIRSLTNVSRVLDL